MQPQHHHKPTRPTVTPQRTPKDPSVSYSSTNVRPKGRGRILTVNQFLFHWLFATKSSFRLCYRHSLARFFSGRESAGQGAVGCPDPVLIDLKERTPALITTRQPRLGLAVRCGDLTL